MTTSSSPVKPNPSQFPDTIYVYVADYSDGEIIHGVVSDPNDLPEDQQDDLIGVYKLEQRAQFVIRKELMEWKQ